MEQIVKVFIMFNTFILYSLALIVPIELVMGVSILILYMQINILLLQPNL